MNGYSEMAGPRVGWRGRLAVVVLAAIFQFSVMAADENRASEVPFRAAFLPVADEHKLGQAPQIVTSAVSTRNRMHAYYLERNENKYRLIFDSQPGPWFDGITIVCVRDTDGFFAYTAEKGGKGVVVTNGHEGPEYDWAGNLRIRISGNMVAYVASINKQNYIFADDKCWPIASGTSILDLYTTPYNNSVLFTGWRPSREIFGIDGREIEGQQMLGYPRYSGDDKHMAYIIGQGSEQFVVVDGVEGARFDEINFDSLAFIPGAGEVAYIARKGGKKLVVASGVNGPEYDDISGLVLAPGGEHIFYSALQGRRWRAVVDGREWPNFEAVWAVATSADAKRHAFIAYVKSSWSVVADEKTGPEFDEISPESLKFSPDGQHLVYLGRKGEAWRVVFDGKISAAYEEVLTPGFSPDGRTPAYAARNGTTDVLVSNGSEVKVGGKITSLTFSPDGRHFVCALEDGNRVRYLIDGIEGPVSVRQMGPAAFSPDSKHLAIWLSEPNPEAGKIAAPPPASVGRGRAGPVMNWVLWVDGHTGASYTEFPGFVAPRPYFTPEGTIEFLAIRDKALYRIVQMLPPM